MMALGSVRSQYLDGGYGLDCAQETAAVMDKAVKEILEKCYADAVKVIEENIDDMHKVVAYLLEKETITGGEMVAILEGRDPATVEDAYASTRRSDSDFRPSVPSTIEAPGASHLHDEREDRNADAGAAKHRTSPPHPTRRTARKQKRPRRRPLRRTLPPVTARKRPTTNKPKAPPAGGAFP